MEKKKFRLNIIDIIILLLILCAGIFAVMKFSDGGIGQAASTDKVRITFFQEECADYIIESTNVGDALYDETEALSLGVVTGMATDDSWSYQTLEDGTVVRAPKEGYRSVYITGEVNGTLCDNGVMVGSTLYSVGHSLVLHAGYGKYYLKVYSIERIE